MDSQDGRVESSHGSCPSPEQYYWSNDRDVSEDEDSEASHYFEPLPPSRKENFVDLVADSTEEEEEDETTSKPPTKKDESP